MISVICGGRFYKTSCFENMISAKVVSSKTWFLLYVVVDFTRYRVLKIWFQLKLVSLKTYMWRSILLDIVFWKYDFMSSKTWFLLYVAVNITRHRVLKIWFQLVCSKKWFLLHVAVDFTWNSVLKIWIQPNSWVQKRDITWNLGFKNM